MVEAESWLDPMSVASTAIDERKWDTQLFDEIIP